MFLVLYLKVFSVKVGAQKRATKSLSISRYFVSFQFVIYYKDNNVSCFRHSWFIYITIKYFLLQNESSPARRSPQNLLPSFTSQVLILILELIIGMLLLIRVEKKSWIPACPLGKQPSKLILFAWGIYILSFLFRYHYLISAKMACLNPCLYKTSGYRKIYLPWMIRWNSF